MKHVLDTTRILEDEDKGIPYYRRCVMPYVDVCGPLEDMTAEFPEEEFVTGFYDMSGEQILVLEPFQKVMDGWMLYLEQSMHQTIKFKQPMTAKERIIAIEKRQATLAKKVKQAQQALYQLLLESIDKIEKDPAYVERVFNQYQQSAGVKLVSSIAVDVNAIATYNYTYFLSYKDELDLSGKDFSKIKGSVDSFIQDRIGLNGNKVVADSFLDTVLTDTTVKQKVKQQAYQNLLSGQGATGFRKSMKTLVLGDGEKLGALEAHYNTFVYDTYNQVDRSIQEKYSEELELTAFVYEGGLISSSRKFCIDKNGEVFLRSEAIEQWPKQLKEGRPQNYDPLIHMGGYGCRHAKSYITNRRAMRLRDDLELKAGKLQVKG